MKVFNAVFLEGQGDMEIYLVNDEYFNWINNRDINPPDELVEEYSKKWSSEYDTKDDIIEKLQGDPRGWHNDRALQLGCNKNILQFMSIKSYTQYVVENQIQIDKEYQGYIY